MKLAHTLNRTVLISIPAFFGDDEARACTIVDLEPAGMWLAVEDWKEPLGSAVRVPSAWNGPVTGFFPFDQILCVVDPSQFAILARPGPRPAAPRPAVAALDATRDDTHREGRRKPKDGKSRR